MARPLFDIETVGREDIMLAGLALFRGFKVTYDKARDSFLFEKGIYHVWPVKDGWRLAVLEGDKYSQHETIGELGKALSVAYDKDLQDKLNTPAELIVLNSLQP